MPQYGYQDLDSSTRTDPFPADRTMVGDSADHGPYSRIDLKIPANRLGDLDRAGIVRDFTRLVLTAEGSPVNSVEGARVWVLIRDIPR